MPQRRKKAMSVLDRISSLKETPPTVKVCLYGPPGVGKTTFAAMAPKPLVIDVEHGARSLLNLKETEDVDVLPVTSVSDIEDIIWEAREGNLDQYETFILDSLSEFQALDLTNRVKDKAQKDASKNAFAATFGDYKENTEYLRRIIIALRDLDKHIVLISHDKEDKDESTGRIFVRPSVTPKLAETVKGLMDLQAYLTLEVSKDGTETRVLQTRPGNNIQVKSRIGGLPALIENPTFEMILKANTNTGEEA